jgi:hypothetical protein
VARPLIAPTLQGFSGTVFAYGVTSSGKTHTVMGGEASNGEPRTVAVIDFGVCQALCIPASHNAGRRYKLGPTGQQQDSKPYNPVHPCPCRV